MKKRIYCPACAQPLTAEYGEWRQPLPGRANEEIMMLNCPACGTFSVIVVDGRRLKDGGASTSGVRAKRG